MNYFFLISTIVLSIVHPAFSGENTWCTEEYECQDEEISSDIVSCISYFSCYEASIESNETFCTGNYGCAESTIEAERLLCVGNYACDSSSISTDGDDDSFALCNSFFSCNEAAIDTTDDAVLFGAPFSGYESTVVTQDLYAISASSFVYADATVSRNLYCDAPWSCAYSEIEFSSDCEDELVAQVMGSYGLYESTVSSGENNAITWYFYGLWAIDSMTINCESGSTCDFYCIAGGCMNYETASYTCDGECNIYCIYTFDDACPSTDDESINVFVLQGEEASNKLSEFEKLVSKSSKTIKTYNNKAKNVNTKTFKHNKNVIKKFHKKDAFAAIGSHAILNKSVVWVLLISVVIFVIGVAASSYVMCWARRGKSII